MWNKEPNQSRWCKFGCVENKWEESNERQENEELGAEIGKWTSEEEVAVSGKWSVEKQADMFERYGHIERQRSC